MTWGNKKGGVGPTSDEEIANVLEPSTVVKGDLKSDRGFRVDGKVDGSIESAAAIVIGEQGTVTGEVRGTDVIVVGRVDGNIHASGHLDIRATGKVIGDVWATSVRIETGGIFRGTSCMGSEGNAPSEREISAATSLA